MKETAASDKIASLSLEKRKLLERLLQKGSRSAKVAPSHWRDGKIGPVRAPTSGTQQRLWFIDRLEGSSVAYHIPVALRLRGDLDCAALQTALDALVSRHESLRTVFPETDGEPVQEILVDAKFALRQVDLSNEVGEQQSVEVQRHLRVELDTPFDMSAGPLIRGRLLRLSSSEHLFLIIVHHIVCDGWSIAVLIRELAALYRAHKQGESDPLPALPIQYADYVHWHREAAADEGLIRRLQFWKEHLRGAPAILELPTDRPRPPVQSYRGAVACISLDRHLAAQLRSISRRFECTLAMTLLSAWSILLSRLSGQRDVVLGMPVANRRRAEFEGVVGFFANTIAVRIRMDDDATLTDLLQQAKHTLLLAYANQDVPFEHVVEALQPERNLSHSPVFQSMFGFQSDSAASIDLPELTLVEERVPLRTSQFDLTLAIQESPDEIAINANYATDLFDETTIVRWVGYFENVLRELVRDPRQKVSAVQFLSDDERHQLLTTFNATRAAYPRERLIHELFEAQVERTPHEVAVRSGGEHLTYSQLNNRANRLARYLRQQGAGPDRFVGLCVERGIEMVVGLLGILKSGGAYVPLDPNYPQHRLEYMLEDTAPIAVLTQEHLQNRLPSGHNVVALDTYWNEIDQHTGLNLVRAPEASSSNLAYVIYTSGSTGRPKGVAIEHRNAVNMICWAQSAMSMEVFEQTLQSTSLNFDLSVYECFVPLVSGGSLWVVQNALALVSEADAKVTLINTVPSAISSLLDAGGVPTSTRVVNLAGEALKKELVDRIFAQTAAERVNNLYGPSETTTYSTWISMPREEGFNATVGRPIANTQIYILDAQRQLMPVGSVGEIYIGGDGVARGYLNREELTAERFIRDPFSVDPLARMYKTGDLGRWRADGTVEYLGRNDHQVKIRGFRIELEEIEARLVRHAQVKQAVVLAREDLPGEKRLVAYLVSREPTEQLSVEQLRQHLKQVLPEYMVPSAFVQLEQMPLTPNGKLDRHALPAPELGAFISRAYEAPQGEVEEILAGIWQALLRVERVGRHDNFFELGGHSLLIVQVMERLRRVGLSVPLRRVFDNPTLADLAAVLTSEVVEQFEVPPNAIPLGCERITPEMLPLVELQEQDIDRIVQAVPGGASNVEDIYPLVPLQEGILFHHLLDEEKGDAYVLPLVFRVVSRERVDELIAAIQTVIDRHAVLRTSVLWERLPSAVQVVHRHVALPVGEVKLSRDVDVRVQMEEWLQFKQQRMDIRCAPLLRMQIAADPNSSAWYVMLQLHHIMLDHLALEIVVSEVVALLERREHASIAAAPYRNHVAQVLAYARTCDDHTFFDAKLGDVEEPTAPFGLMNVHGDGSETDEAGQPLDPALARRVRAQARRAGVSAATLFHAAWGLVVAHTSGRDDVVFGTVLLGRLQGAAGIERTLGMFINTLPLRLQLHGTTARSLVERTQRELVELLGHEHASLADAQRRSGIVGSAPLFSAIFNYRHTVPDPHAQWNGAAGIETMSAQERTNYPITLSVDDLGEGGFSMVTQTDRRIDPRRLLDCLRTAIESLLEALEQGSDAPALSLSILSQSERRQALEAMNATAAPYPAERLIHELVEEQVARRSETVAVIHGDRSLTYAELNSKANQLARYLRARGIGANQLVGLCFDRCIDMVVGLLGTLKAGGAYLPLDPSYPPERLQYMLQDAAPRVVLTQAHLKSALPTADAEIIDVDAAAAQLQVEEDENLARVELAEISQPLVYVIYTSGSTGAPKGTAMSHRAMTNLIQWHRDHDRLGQPRRTLQFAALSFDVAFQDIFSTLCTGGTLVLLDEWMRRDARALLELLRDQSIERLFLPPLMLQSLAECQESSTIDLSRLRDVITAGEQLRIGPETIALFRRLEDCALHNHYGPTETHVVTALTLQGDPAQWPALPTIGTPIANSRIYILDTHGRPVPWGVTGEIYIAGANVAQGYLHRPEMTATRFLRDPFTADPHARMYKTGDVGRWNRDGNVEYLGRNDDQVKIRGYRIELGEIEAQLAKHSHVREAAVVAREGTAGERRLVAYVTVHDGIEASIEELRVHLKALLPDHMVPSAFVVLESLPLTPSGKLNRKALPAPGEDAYAVRAFEPPQGAAEQGVAEIWQVVLGLNRVGRDDDFFELGGHSLLVLKALSRVNQVFGCSMRVTDLYKNPTVRTLAERLSGNVREDDLVDLAREATLDSRIVPLPRPYSAVTRVVLLTGATGFVGRFLLAQLLSDTSAKIYCLVRAQSQRQAEQRLRTTLSYWDLWRDELESRIVAIKGDLRSPRLGIDEITYRRLSREVDCIYHCATSMNHLETYAMAKAANVDASRELLELATSETPKRINFISTMGVFGASASDPARTVDELTPIDSERHRQSHGYLASKWVAEKIFMIAAERGIACNIFRLGLVWADTRGGRFDELQAVYRVLKSCLLCGYGIESYHYPMAPTPVDYVARAVVFLAGWHRQGGGIFHISSAAQPVEGVFERCNRILDRPLELLPYHRWLGQVRRLHQAGESLPVVPLIDSVFAMDEASLREHERSVRSVAHIHFDLTRTHQELERGGIIAPAVDDELLKLSLHDMMSRDEELRIACEKACQGRMHMSGGYEAIHAGLT